jgi:hypothetical protein
MCNGVNFVSGPFESDFKQAGPVRAAEIAAFAIMHVFWYDSSSNVAARFNL